MTTPDSQTFVVEDGCINLSLEAEEERGIELPNETGEQSANIDMRHAMVGRFLTDKHIKFEYMQQVLASVWRPVMGIRVKEIRANLFIFQFFHERDLARVLDNGPWGFENYTLICKRLGPDDIPEKTPLFFLDIWAQIFDLPCGYMSEKIAVLVGNHMGSFIASDPNNFLGGWRSFLRIRVSLDVRLPLKRKMKMKKKDDSYFWVSFKYERLHTFCYFCGILGHSVQFCRKFYEIKEPPEELPFGAWLRAKLRPPENSVGTRWLVEDGAGKTEDYNDSDNGLQTDESGERAINESKVGRTGNPNKAIQEDTPPTMDFKRRRSSDSPLEKRTELRATSSQAVKIPSASPAM